jgi:hypothetical protein
MSPASGAQLVESTTAGCEGSVSLLFEPDDSTDIPARGQSVQLDLALKPAVLEQRAGPRPPTACRTRPRVALPDAPAIDGPKQERALITVAAEFFGREALWFIARSVSSQFAPIAGHRQADTTSRYGPARRHPSRPRSWSGDRPSQ